MTEQEPEINQIVQRQKPCLKTIKTNKDITILIDLPVKMFSILMLVLWFTFARAQVLRQQKEPTIDFDGNATNSVENSTIKSLNDSFFRYTNRFGQEKRISIINIQQAPVVNLGSRLKNRYGHGNYFFI